jgi:MoaA/NifB/PqqE/SkfB family radical SAM enzyme
MKYPGFNLHIRLTTACNADCSYCSCESDVPSDRMLIDDLQKSLIFALDKFLPRTSEKTYCGAEVIGGEVVSLFLFGLSLRFYIRQLPYQYCPYQKQ